MSTISTVLHRLSLTGALAGFTFANRAWAISCLTRPPLFSPRAMASFYSSSEGASTITGARSNAFVHLALRTCNILASFTWFVVNGQSRSAGCRGGAILAAGERRVLDERARACMTEKRLGRTGATSSSNDHRPSLPVALAPPSLYRHSKKSIHRRHRRRRFPGKRYVPCPLKIPAPGSLTG
ncbi:hypothetical protein C8J56DRAFT_410654 [Mycena floridula]|nr:hypothetical protein C8J56DRAFT_410654 [Mycena floridula]